MTSEIDKLKHFHVENYSDTNFTDDLNDGEEFLYTTIRCEDDKEVLILFKNYVIGILLVLFDLLMKNGKNILKLVINIELILIK